MRYRRGADKADSHLREERSAGPTRGPREGRGAHHGRRAAGQHPARHPARRARAPQRALVARAPRTYAAGGIPCLTLSG